MRHFAFAIRDRSLGSVRSCDNSLKKIEIDVARTLAESPIYGDISEYRYIMLFRSRELGRGKQLQEMDENKEKEMVEEEKEPQEAATRLAIYTLHTKMSGAISEIPSCRFPVPLECHCTRPSPPFKASRDLSSVSSSSKPASVLLLSEFIASRHPRCDATWS